jgi:hypothetical protein
VSKVRSTPLARNRSMSAAGRVLLVVGELAGDPPGAVVDLRALDGARVDACDELGVAELLPGRLVEERREDQGDDHQPAEDDQQPPPALVATGRTGHPRGGSATGRPFAGAARRPQILGLTAHEAVEAAGLVTMTVIVGGRCALPACGQTSSRRGRRGTDLGRAAVGVRSRSSPPQERRYLPRLAALLPEALALPLASPDLPGFSVELSWVSVSTSSSTTSSFAHSGSSGSPPRATSET